MMVTTIIAVVYFTVFLQGMTVGALVKILNVPRANKYELSMNERIHTRLMDHIMAGIEDISGMMVGNYKLRDKFRHYNNKYLRVWLVRDSNENGNSGRKIFETCSKLNLQDAMNIVNASKQQNLLLNNNNFLSANKSLSALFRTFTQTNLTNLSPNDETPSSVIPLDNSAETFNFDIRNIAYSPSQKDMADEEIHHILDDAMFKPVKKVRRYSRADLQEPPQVHPPFQHHIRMQIRHMISQQSKHKRRNHLQKRAKEEKMESNRNSFTNGVIPNITIQDKNDYNNDDDSGITFTAKSDPQSAPQTRAHSTPEVSSPSSVTITESTLPWRRESSDEEVMPSGEPIKQEEFPPWIDNKEYMPCYASPTNTFLGKLDDNHSSSAAARMPAVYEIFTIAEGAENANRSDSGSSVASKDMSSHVDNGVTRGRFQCTSASTEEPLNPTVSINMAFEHEDNEHNESVSKL